MRVGLDMAIGSGMRDASSSRRSRPRSHELGGMDLLPRSGWRSAAGQEDPTALQRAAPGRTAPRLPVALSGKNQGLSAFLTDTLRLVRSGHVSPQRHCRGEETGASPRQLRLLAAAVALARRTGGDDNRFLSVRCSRSIS